jgi:predicted nicotinamide N-methyase
LSSTQQFIRARLSLRPVPTLPTLRLFQAGPESGLSQRGDAKPPPYWAFVWGGGLALARYLLDHPMIVAGRSALDLGAGSGLVGIAAAKAGASRILAADVDPDALAAVALNAAENEVEVLAICEDLTLASPPPVDVVLVGDLFYERPLALRVESFLNRSAARGAKILVGDPGRKFLPSSRLSVVAEYPGVDFAETARGQVNRVYAFEREPRR